MTWIRFDPEEHAAPLNRLLDLPGASPHLTDFYGQANLVIFFAHSRTCPACARIIDEFVRHADEYKDRDTIVVVVLKGGRREQAGRYLPVHLLVDPSGAARQQLGSLLEFDTQGKLLLVILNVYGAPSAAWIGDEPEPQDELHQRTLQRLDYISIQCPE